MCSQSQINFDALNIWEVGDSITEGAGDGVSEVGGCGWRALLRARLNLSSMSPVFLGTLTGGYLVATCPENGLAMAHDGHHGFTCPMIQAGLAGWLATIGGTFDVMLLMAGTNDLLQDQTNHTTLAQGNFDALLAAAVALRPTARFFVSNLPPSPGLFTAPLGIAFAAHVASQVAALAAGGTKAYLIDHFNGTTPNGTVDKLVQASGVSGQDFTQGTVHPAGPAGAAVPPQTFLGYPKMALITYLTMTWALP